MIRREADQADSLDRALSLRRTRALDAEPAEPEALLSLADELREQLGPVPAAPAVQDRIGMRVMNQIRPGRRAERPRRSPALTLLRRTAMAILAVALIAGLTGGTAWAASLTYPGDILYPVKLAGESLELALSPSEEGDARLLLRFADRRLKETAHLLGTGEEALAVQTLGHYDESMTHLAVITSSFADDAKLERARTALARQRREIQVLLAGAPPAVVPALEHAEKQAGHAQESLPSHQPTPPSAPPDRPPSTRAPSTPPGQAIKATRQSGQDRGAGQGNGPRDKTTPTPPP
jgi:hypothetical protein